jgi:predicted GIY-YIG superfamily endonuclease
LATAYGGVPPKAEKAKDIMYFVYIIKSEKTEKFYIGMTYDIFKRLKHHNSGANRSTKNKGP